VCYHYNGDVMNMVDEFDSLERYKLYRSLYEVIHPTISKKNISNYKIVLKDDLVPIRVFYPEKISSIDSFIIYIHGLGEITGNEHSYSSICKELAINTKKLVLAIDYRFGDNYKFPVPLNDCYEVVKYIYQNINSYGIDPNKVVIMGDSFGGNLVASLVLKIKYEGAFVIDKQVLISPILDNNISDTKFNMEFLSIVNKVFKYYISDLDDIDNSLVYPLKENDYSNMPNTLIIVGNGDPYKDFAVKYFQKLGNNNNKFINMELYDHSFFTNSDDGFKKKFYDEINDFIK